MDTNENPFPFARDRRKGSSYPLTSPWRQWSRQVFHQAKKRHAFAIVAGVVFSFASNLTLQAADTVVTQASESALRAALNNGGTVKLACDGTILLTNTLVITKDVVLDGTGRNVTLDGGGAVRVFLVQTNIHLTLRNLTVARGRADQGGGLLNNGGSVVLLDSVFHSSQAVGRDTNSLAAMGGGVYSAAGKVSATNTLFATNTAIGGHTKVGTGGLIGPVRIEARGGAIAIQDGVLNLVGCRFTANLAAGGIYDADVFGGTKGGAFGGAVFIKNSEGSVWDCQFDHNLAQSPERISFDLDRGVNVHGGAIHQEGAGLLELVGCAFVGNRSLGGDGGRNGGNGDGRGGAVSAYATLVADNCSFESNVCVGGSGGAFSGGHAFGGALYATNTTALNHCLFSGNQALAGSGCSCSLGGDNGNANGGAVFAQGALQILNSTFALNWVEGPNITGYPPTVPRPGSNAGGALFSAAVCVATNSIWFQNRAMAQRQYTGSQLTREGAATGAAIHQIGNPLALAHCVITNNAIVSLTTSTSAGIVIGTNATARLFDCLVSGNMPANLAGSIVDDGFNLSSDHTVFFAAASSRNDVNLNQAAGTPPAGQASPEVVAWGDNAFGQRALTGGLSNLVAIAAGGYHSLALTDEGLVVAWGDNAYGQTNVPSGLSSVVAIAAGPRHSLALTAAGRVMGWGDNTWGQMMAPSTLSNVEAMAAGYAHSLALTAQGQVVAWGEDYLGQTTVPSALSNVVAIAAGASHSLALTAQGQVVGWGDNAYGQATAPGGLSNVVAIAAKGAHSLALTAAGRVVAWGYSESNEANLPSGLSNVVAIAAGPGHSLALTAEGRMVAWGDNVYDQTNVPGGLSNAVAIAAGQRHSLALTGLPPGMAKPAWVGPQFLVATVNRPFHHRIMVRNGATYYGTAGLPPGLALDPGTGLITGQPTQTGKYSVTFSATNSMGSCEWTITLFVNLFLPAITSSEVVLVALGNGFSYGVASDNAPEWYGASGLPTGLIINAKTGVISGVPLENGDFVVSLMVSNRFGSATGSLTLRVWPVLGWGNNDYGQTTPPSGLSNLVAIAAGEDHSLALAVEGRMVAWGDNSSGQTVVPGALSNVVAIAAGSFHSLALTAEGQVVAWGWNRYGQTTMPNGLSNVVAIAAGRFHSLALTTEGQVVAWGDNSLGQTTLPGGLSNVVAIAARGGHSLALTAQGRVVTWGYNSSGQTDMPSGLSNVVGIAAGDSHSLALTAEGLVVSWGAYDQTDVPNGLSNVVAVAAGNSQSLVLTTEGRVISWGSLNQTTVPSGLSNVGAIAAGGAHSLALPRQPTVPAPRLELSRGLSSLELQAQGAPGVSCLLLRASRLPGPWLPAEPVTFTNSAQPLRALDASQPAQFFRLLRK